MRIGLLKSFLVGAKKTKLGSVTELVLLLSVGANYDQKDCCLPCTVNKDQITNIRVSL